MKKKLPSISNNNIVTHYETVANIKGIRRIITKWIALIKANTTVIIHADTLSNQWKVSQILEMSGYTYTNILQLGLVVSL